MAVAALQDELVKYVAACFAFVFAKEACPVIMFAFVPPAVDGEPRRIMTNK